MRFTYTYIAISVNSTEILYLERKGQMLPSTSWERAQALRSKAQARCHPEEHQPWNLCEKQASGNWGKTEKPGGTVASVKHQPTNLHPNHNIRVQVWDIIFILDAFHMALLPTASPIQRIREQGQTWGAKEPQKSLWNRIPGLESQWPVMCTSYVDRCECIHTHTLP